eukprot:NODE_29_length_37665_cov_1.081563.p30 type:complete len:119 gc:universal NODE_29_length_37665_cov_1.081563:27177-26821(-)
MLLKDVSVFLSLQLASYSSNSHSSFGIFKFSFSIGVCDKIMFLPFLLLIGVSEESFDIMDLLGVCIFALINFLWFSCWEFESFLITDREFESDASCSCFVLVPASTFLTDDDLLLLLL